MRSSADKPVTASQIVATFCCNEIWVGWEVKLDLSIILGTEDNELTIFFLRATSSSDSRIFFPRLKGCAL